MASKSKKTTVKKELEAKFEEIKSADFVNEKDQNIENDSTIKEQNNITRLAKFLSGEMEMQKKQEELEKAKVAGVKKQRNKLRNRILNRKAVIEVENPQELVNDPTPKKVVQKLKVFEWEAPIRVKFEYDQRTFMSIVAGFLLFILYLALLGNYGLMFSIIAILFLVYVASTTEPIDVKHVITTRGIESIDKHYDWYMLDQFWFTVKNDQPMLIVSTKLRMPANLIMLHDSEDRKALFVLLQDKLLYKEIDKQSRIDKSSFGEYIPLENI